MTNLLNESEAAKRVNRASAKERSEGCGESSMWGYPGSNVNTPTQKRVKERCQRGPILLTIIGLIKSRRRPPLSSATATYWIAGKCSSIVRVHG